MVIIDILPFFGSIKNAVESLLANLSHDNKLARDKGITALVAAAIDLLGLCLGVASVAYSYEKFNKIDTFATINNLLIMAILVSVIALMIGTKIVIDQLVKLLVDNLIGVNTASAAMVDSVTITANCIEAFVATVSDATNNVILRLENSWQVGYNSAKYIIYAPIRAVKTITKCLSDSQRYAEEKIVKKCKENFVRVVDNFLYFIQVLFTVILVLIALSVRAVTKCSAVHKKS